MFCIILLENMIGWMIDLTGMSITWTNQKAIVREEGSSSHASIENMHDKEMKFIRDMIARSIYQSKEATVRAK